MATLDDILPRLEALQDLLRRVPATRRRALHEAPAGGFRDHRAYAPGDDIRRIDWAQLARSGRAVVRRSEDRETAVLVVVVDGSGSMEGKDDDARSLAAAVAYLGLHRRDRVLLRVLGGGTAGGRAGAETGGRGVGAFPRFVRALEEARPAGPMDLSAEAAILARGPFPPGARSAVVISDLLDPRAGAAIPGLVAALGATTFVQILAADEVRTDPLLDAELVDAERGDALRLRVGEDAARAYGRAAESFIRETAATAKGAGARHVLHIVGTPMEETVRRLIEAGAFG